MASCNPSVSILRSWQGVLEVVLRSVCMVMGLATLVCAATAVNNLNADAISLRDVEQSRDKAVTGTGVVVFMALLAILMEIVIIVLRFCTEGIWNAVVEVVINLLFALVYFCLIIPMAVFAHEWRNREISSGVISNDVGMIGDSLAAASIFCFFLCCTFIMLAGWICVFLYFEWNTEVLKKATSAVGECDLSLSIVDSYPGLVEVIVRSICIVLGFPTFVSAAAAVNNLNAIAAILGYVEQFRDKTVAVAAIAVFMGLLTMLTETAIIAMRLCTKGAFSVVMGMLTSCVYALMYLCLGISMAVFSEEWKNLQITSMGSGESGYIPDGVDISISDSLAAASAFCFFSMFMVIVLAVWMFLFVYNDWNEEFEQERENPPTQYQGSRSLDIYRANRRTTQVVADIRETYTTTVEARRTITLRETVSDNTLYMTDY